MYLRPAFAALLVFAAVSSNSVRLTAAEEPETTLTRSFKVANGGKLMVKIDQGSVHVTGGNQATAEFEVIRKVKRGSGEKARDLLAKHEITFSQDGDTVRLDAELKGRDKWNWRGPQLEVEVRITVPREFNVDVHTAGGSVHATELKGELALKTSGGSLQLDSLEGTVNARTSGGSIRASHVSGAVELNTSGGSIDVKDVRGDKLKANTAGGSITLREISVPTEAHTSGGSVSVETSATPLQAGTSGGSIQATFTAPPKADALLKTSGGGVTVTLPESAAFNLDASTSAGSVHSDFPITTVSTKFGDHDNSSLKGPANGGGPSLKLRSSAGSIRVKRG